MTTRLRACGGHNIKVLGSIQVIVENKAGQELKNVSMLVVVEGRGPDLLGRDLLSSLRLDLKRVCSLGNPFDELLDRYPEVFSEGLGMYKGEPAKIHVDVSVKRLFYKARSVPYTLTDLVNNQPDKMESQGVISPVRSAEWAAPIVPVLKDRAQASEFVVTINKQSIEHQKWNSTRFQELKIFLRH